MKLIEYTDSEIMWLALADTIAGDLRRGLMQRDRVSLAVPGGTTPGPVFDLLSDVELEWDRVDVLLTDERWVPEDDPRSNARLLRERLLVGRAAGAHFLPFYTGGTAPGLDLVDVAAAVDRLRPLTFLLLGMGTDMHTASLFPGADNLGKALSETAPSVVAMQAPASDVARVTLSAPVLTGAMSRHLVIVGAEKRAALLRAERIGDPMQAPVAAVLENLKVHWAEN